MYKLLHTGCGGRNLQIRREGDKVRGRHAEASQGKSRHKDHRGVDFAMRRRLPALVHQAARGRLKLRYCSGDLTKQVCHQDENAEKRDHPCQHMSHRRRQIGPTAAE
jgi:hypothetical protein